MKAYGFKQLKRKEGLSFYLKGFMKNRPFKGVLNGSGCNHLDDSDYLSDASDYSVSID
jgi:hypothetical protein